MASLSIRPPATPRELLDRSTSLRVTLLLSTLLNVSAVCNTGEVGCVMLFFTLQEAELLLRETFAQPGLQTSGLPAVEMCWQCCQQRTRLQVHASLVL